MKKIYIVLTHTGTNLSKIIKFFTKDEFSHISIALDQNLDEMYSFGRLNPYNPFWGGFVHEKINEGTFKRFYKTMSQVYSLEIDETKYNKIKEAIEIIKKDKKKYKFNIIGLFAVGLHKRIHFDNSFYCAEFVKYVLDKSDIETNLPEIIRPENFKALAGMKQEYKGRLKDYRNRKKNLIYT